MQRDKQTNTKAVLLAGVTVLAATADVQAGLITSTYKTFLLESDAYVPDNNSVTFETFNTALGNLTGVTFDLSSYISSAEAEDITAAITVNGVEISSFSTDGDYSFLGLDGTGGGAINLSFFEGNGIDLFPVNLFFEAGRTNNDVGGCGGICIGDGADWYGNNTNVFTDLGLRINYTYSEPVPTPLPATLPLLAIGLAGLGICKKLKSNTTKYTIA